MSKREVKWEGASQENLLNREKERLSGKVQSRKPTKQGKREVKWEGTSQKNLLNREKERLSGKVQVRKSY